MRCFAATVALTALLGAPLPLTPTARAQSPASVPSATRTSDAERVVRMFRAAYERRPDPRVLLNLAMALHALRRDCEAAETFAVYLRDHAGYRAELTTRARRYRAAALRRGRCRPTRGAPAPP